METDYHLILVLAFTAALAMSACGTQAGDSTEIGSDHNFHVTRSDSRTLALNQGGPKFPGEFDIERDLVIGREDGPEEYILFRPTDLAVDGRGRMFLFDWSRKGILVYDRDGTYLRTLGREGQGPGEFGRSGAADLFSYPDGMIDAIASAGTTWKRWDPGGELLFDHRAFNLRTAPGMIRFPTRAGIKSYARTNRSAVIDTMTAWRIHQVSGDARLQEVVAVYPLRRRSYAEGVSVGIVLPYIADPSISRGPTGLFAVTMGDSAWFDLYDEDFRHLLTVRWDDLPQPLERKDFLDAFWELPFNEPEAVDDPVWEFYQTVEPPADKPVIHHLMVDSDDRIWVRLWGEKGWPDGWGPQPDRIPYAVFDREGEYLYRVNVPFQIEAVQGHHLYEVFSDGEHTPQVRRYRWYPPNEADARIQPP